MNSRMLAQYNLLVISVVLLSISSWTELAIAQESPQEIQSSIAEHLQFGEFASALEIVEQLPTSLIDEQLALVATAQSRSGGHKQAVATIARIESDKIRSRALFQQLSPTSEYSGAIRGDRGVAGDWLSPSEFGNRGGVTVQDFQPLINLIKSTIDPDSWDDADGDGTIQPFPAGVYVDSRGTMHRLKIDPKRNLRQLAGRAEIDSGNRAVDQPSRLRKVSLRRLERELQLHAAQGLPLDPVAANLAGIFEIKYLMLLPESNDIVIAGAAGPWILDSDGHAVNRETGKPVICLDDLIVCLRNAQPAPLGNQGKFGCSINPRQENLQRANEFIATTTLKGSAWRRELRDVMGFQDIEFFGIDSATHAGRVLVEADYRMKLLAMGIEPSIPQIPSYLSRLSIRPDGSTDATSAVRFWFTMNYDQIVSDEKQRVFELQGTGVKVLSENEFINRRGDRIHTGESEFHTAGFAADFTRHFEQIAAEYPVYCRLKNLFDLSIVSSLIRRFELDRRADWNLTYFGNDPEYAATVYQPATEMVPTQVHSVLNHRDVTVRRNGKTLKQSLVGVSGGVNFDALEVLRNQMQIRNLESPVADEIADSVGRRSGLLGSSRAWWWD